MDLSEDDKVGCGWGAPCEPKPTNAILLSTTCGHRLFNAYTFGAWAVHQAYPSVENEHVDPDSWQVSHAPSGKALGIADEMGFWDAIRVARALEDTGLLLSDDLSEIDADVCHVIEAAVGAALHDHYVWPIYAISGEASDGQISL